MTDIATELRRLLMHLTIATAALYAVVIVLIMFVWIDSGAKREALQTQTDRTNHALCTLRNDLDRRTIASKEFLREHPEGLPGIPAAVIRTSIQNQEQTIRALATLKCRG